MLHVVHVAAQVVDHAVVGKPQGTVARFLAKVARERQDIDLEAGSGIVKLLITLAPTGVVGITLGMSQNGLVALYLHVKKQIVKVHQLLLERVLKQDMIARHGNQVIGGILLVKILVHAVFCTQIQINVQAGIGNGILQGHEGIHEGFTCVLK